MNILKTLAVALLFPIITGFSNEVPDPHAAGAGPTGSVAAPQEPALAEPAAVRYNWRVTGGEKAESVAQAAANGRAVSAGDSAEGKVKREDDEIHSWETGAGKSYKIPAIEVPTFLLLLNLANRVVNSDDRDENGKKTYSSNLDTTWDHLIHQNWGYDTDPFNVNQFAHPYQGATMYGLARSCGLGFWESWAYANVGSFIYEMAGETTRPSINDLITTGQSGSLLGEALIRMSALVLNNQETPDAWHEFGAALISPPNAFNRYAFGNRFKEVFPTRTPATFWRFRFGAIFGSENDATIDFAMSYGLPGKPGYAYKRPLDYFDFQISGLSSGNNPVGNVLLRGLLAGKSYDVGDDYRGIWGIYGSYDYISPTNFRVSTTAASLGTTGQYWIAPEVALQGTVLGGVGFGGAGVTPAKDGDRDYHYGVTPQAMLALRLILGERMAVENVMRGYYVSGTGSDNSEGSEEIFRINSNVIFRIYDRHGIGLQVVDAVRNAQYGSLPGRHQSELAVGFFYTFLGDAKLGAVDWRTPKGS